MIENTKDLSPAQFTSDIFGTVRTLTDARNGEIWFVAKDVCATLGIANSRDALSKLDGDEKGGAFADTPGGKQLVNVVNESGLYFLIIRSNKPEAKKFRKWVTSEIIPAIRKTGAYIQKERVTPDFLRQVADEIDKKNFEIAEKNAALKAAQPKVEMADSLTNTQTRYKPTYLAVILGVSYRALREAAFSIGMIRKGKCFGKDRYLPTIPSMTSGFCVPRENNGTPTNYDFTSTGAALVRRALINAGHKPSNVEL